MGLYTSAHYKNTPNDLQMLSDAPAHSVFVLLSPSAEQDSNSLPDILAVVQVSFSVGSIINHYFLHARQGVAIIHASYLFSNCFRFE
mmetsp:Transcript_12497/g.16686  ORF Transcript_12497/g.16686 Transcript_12497/m.16686 type:complete len:87 (-) Transcript_12497:598-858(-)